MKQSLTHDEIASRRPATPPDFGGALTLPLGGLCLPGLRWILRIHHLDDDEATRYLLREYILSAWNVAHKFADFLDQTQPRAVVVFNGQFYPEATARYSPRNAVFGLSHMKWDCNPLPRFLPKVKRQPTRLQSLTILS